MTLFDIVIFKQVCVEKSCFSFVLQAALTSLFFLNLCQLHCQFPGTGSPENVISNVVAKVATFLFNSLQNNCKVIFETTRQMLFILFSKTNVFLKSKTFHLTLYDE